MRNGAWIEDVDDAIDFRLFIFLNRTKKTNNKKPKWIYTTSYRLLLLQLGNWCIILTRNTVLTLSTSMFCLWLCIHMLLSRLVFLEVPGEEAYLALQGREGRASSQSQSLLFHPAGGLEQQGTWKIWWCHQQTCFGLRGQLNLNWYFGELDYQWMIDIG